MNRKQYTIIGIIMTGALGYVIGWSIQTGNIVLPFVAVAVATSLIYLLKKRVDEVIEDERIFRIFEKASGLTIKIFLPLMAVIGVVLVASNQGGLYDFGREGYTLLYTTSALLMVYMIFYIYYSIRVEKV